MKEYVLYGSVDCCLCEQAMDIINAQGFADDSRVIKVDIYTDKGLLIKYRYTIPVLKELDSSRELPWPFTLDILSQWLESDEALK